MRLDSVGKQNTFVSVTEIGRTGVGEYMRLVLIGKQNSSVSVTEIGGTVDIMVLKVPTL